MMGARMRIGIGYDIHPLVKGRKLMLGGVAVPFSCGLKGHSDADVLVHSVCDAILGAAAKGDMGRHFPGTPEYRGISSLLLLAKVQRILSRAHYVVNNVDTTVIAQSPRLEKFTDEMGMNIAKTLKIEKSKVSVKATTAKGLGVIGRHKAIASLAVATIKKVRSKRG